eukprot:TRINITY_DN1656_c1_g1_i1.p1 TRINITY_DN1656_c1_g1~~TRINITY_DN1656_c1_g1_i1.p1  ORF type:complete len:143 (+),score=21.30 TRINITY_DN1656_c1_g1_i1:522-950(+)
MGTRDTQGSGEHEGSRRMKTELLIQMDGLAKSDDLVFVLAASNLPWSLDAALLRRLEKRIYVPLPNEDARQHMIASHIPDEKITSPDLLRDLIGKTEGFSGSDIYVLCKEISMYPVRRLLDKLDLADVMDDDHRIAIIQCLN